MAEVTYSTVCNMKDVIKLPNYQYMSEVRVVGVGPINQALIDRNIDFSAELCGGT